MQRISARNGFSLMEVMVVMAIVSLLLMTALPGYQRIQLKSRRLAATGMVMNVAARQQQYRQRNKKYALSLQQLGLPAPYYIDGSAELTSRQEAVYELDLWLESGRYLGVVAAARNQQLSDRDCLDFKLGRLGARSVTGELSAEADRCW